MAAPAGLWSLASSGPSWLPPRWPIPVGYESSVVPGPGWQQRTGRTLRWLLSGPCWLASGCQVRPTSQGLAHVWGPFELYSGHLSVQGRAGHPMAHWAPPPPRPFSSPACFYLPHCFPTPLLHFLQTCSRFLVSKVLLRHSESSGGKTTSF